MTQAGKGFSKLLLMAIVVLLSCQLATAQTENGTRNAVYVEFATKGPLYAVCYDRIIRQGENISYSLSAGFSIASNEVAFPVGLHLLTGKGNHHAEISLSLVPLIEYNHSLVGSNKDQADKYIYINPGIGYRYQPKSTGIFFKAAVGPSVLLDPPSDDFWNMDPKLFAIGTIALGISF